MEKEQEKLAVQEAPEKNNDKAFVQVGTDGKPVMPDAHQEQAAKDNKPQEGTLADR